MSKHETKKEALSPAKNTTLQKLEESSEKLQSQSSTNHESLQVRFNLPLTDLTLLIEISCTQKYNFFVISEDSDSNIYKIEGCSLNLPELLHEVYPTSNSIDVVRLAGNVYDYIAKGGHNE